MDVAGDDCVHNRCSKDLRPKKGDLRPLRGFKETSPDEFARKMKVLEKARQLFGLYCYDEIEIPTVEPAALIELKSGEEIRHRMFRFKDLGGRNVVLRPEGTPSVARYAASRLKGKPMPVRLSYVGNMFRYDEPQRGRFREFTHVGFELFGSRSPIADMEIVEITSELLSGLGVHDFSFKFGHQGVLRSVLEKSGVTGNIQDRVLGMIDKGEDSKVAATLRKAPPALLRTMKRLAATRGSDVNEVFGEAGCILSDVPESAPSLTEFRELVNFASEEIKQRVVVDFGFARGIEYYTGMIFEVYARGLNLAIAGGGRYDRLCALVGSDIPAVGVAVGVDRLMMVEEFPQARKALPLAIVLILDGGAHRYGLRVARQLRGNGIPVLLDLSSGSLSSRLERAVKRGGNFAILIGSKEAAEEVVTMKDLTSGLQKTLPLKEAAQTLVAASRGQREAHA